MSSLPPFGTFVVGNKLMAQCRFCQKIVRVSGWLAGWHSCLSPAEREAWRREHGFRSDPFDAKAMREEQQLPAGR